VLETCLDATLNVNEILPSQILIGGNAPKTVYLDKAMDEFSRKRGVTAEDIAQVKKHFDTHNAMENRNISKVRLDTRIDSLDTRIDSVAQKLMSGADTSHFSPEEKKWLWPPLANLYDSGEM